MAKQSGLGDNLYMGVYSIGGDVGVIDTVEAPMSPLPATGIDKSAFERLGGTRDGLLEFTSYFNDAANQEHAALKGLPTADVIGSYFRGTTLGNEAASIVGKQVDYNPSRGDDGSLTLKTRIVANGFGVEWGRMHTAGQRTDSAATNGTGVDGAASSAFGLQMYVHLFAFTGTSVTIKVQESSDDGAGDPYADVTGATTAALTTPQAVRVATSSGLTVERYLRVVTTGTFSNAVFAVNVIRNLTAVVF